jgi:ribosome-binding factor A
MHAYQPHARVTQSTPQNVGNLIAQEIRDPQRSSAVTVRHHNCRASTLVS